MEKFARQSINDGVTGVEELSVSRDCELFRALNMHYNKANDFEVSLRPFRLFHTTKQLHSPYQATLYYEVRFKQWCIRYYFESFPLMLAQFKALKLIQLNDLFIWLDNEWQAVHPVSHPPSPSPYSWGKVNKNFSLFFGLKHSHASVCLMRQTGSDASGPSVLVKYNLQSSHLPLSSLSISAHWDSGHSNTILTTSSSFSWLLAKNLPLFPSLSFRSGQRQGLLWLQVQRTWRTTPFVTRKIFRDMIPIFIYKCKICMAVEESAEHHE